MQRLNREMLERYEIAPNPPKEVTAVQFGMDETLLGCVDRLLDRAVPRMGIACVCAGAPALRLREQEGLYTLLTRGYRGEEAIRQEEVVQCIVEVVDESAQLDALAQRPGLQLAIVNLDSADAAAALNQLARLLRTRFEASLPGLRVWCLSEAADCAGRIAAAIAETVGLAAFSQWLADRCAFCAALADRLVERAQTEEAARQCREMNYFDALIHIAEPFARLTIADGAGMPEGDGIVHVSDIAPALRLRHFAWDGVLSALAAPGWLLGCDTLIDAMRHGRLRQYAGQVITRELLPYVQADRAAASAALIETFARLENPLMENRLLHCAHHLLARFERGALPALRRGASESFDAPVGLSHALAAIIMLYAGARPEADSRRWTVVRGTHEETLWDDASRLEVFETLSHDMPPESLAYAVLADRELWGIDLRETDGLEAQVTLALSAMQRDPSWLPAWAEA